MEEILVFIDPINNQIQKLIIENNKRKSSYIGMEGAPFPSDIDSVE
ncbi:hypothetical protein LCGC14_0928070 [marine sediment metagenome]|uniref:Uncharacterized protein n=1 Tax=marine sediment metagenome TaxID=412755 RepID=A0A0F9R797_9ZZZZ